MRERESDSHHDGISLPKDMKIGGWLFSPCYPRKLRLLHWFSLCVAALLALYVLALAALLPDLPPPLIVTQLQAVGCHDETLAAFCTDAARQTPMGIIAPSADELGFLLGCFLILPMGPLLLLSRSRADGDEVNNFIDNLEDYQRRYRGRQRSLRHGIYMPRPVLFFFRILTATILATFGPSVYACQPVTSFRGRLFAYIFRLCPADPPLHALIVPAIYGFFYVSWSIATYCWRPFRYWQWLNPSRPEESEEEKGEPANRASSNASQLPASLPGAQAMSADRGMNQATPSFGKRQTPTVEKRER